MFPPDLVQVAIQYYRDQAEAEKVHGQAQLTGLFARLDLGCQKKQ